MRALDGNWIRVYEDCLDTVVQCCGWYRSKHQAVERTLTWVAEPG